MICSAALCCRRLGISCHLLALDVLPTAACATRATLQAHGVDTVDVIQADLLSPLLAHVQRKVDLLLFNPPYVVTPDDEVYKGGIATAWAGGRDGRVVIDRLLAQLDDILSATGRLYMVVIDQNKPDDILRELHDRWGLHGKVLLKRRADEELLSVLCVSRCCLRDP